MEREITEVQITQKQGKKGETFTLKNGKIVYKCKNDAPCLLKSVKQ